MKDYIFDTSPSNETNLIKLDYNINTAKPEFDYTRLMEKVKEFGVNKLTEEERKFLDEYGINGSSRKVCHSGGSPFSRTPQRYTLSAYCKL